MNRIAIDLVPIRPGKGGTGSGIWTYARELVGQLNRMEHDAGIELYVLLQRDQVKYLEPFERVHPVVFPNIAGTILGRLLWVHGVLPLWCLIWRMDGLHKLATETPLFCSARRITTVHDFFYEFMAEHGARQAGLAARYFTWITRVAFRKSRSIITVSHAVEEEAQRRYPSTRATIRAVHNGVASPGDASERSDAAARPFTILYIAKLMSFKGQLEALRAFERLADTGARLVYHGFENDTDFVQQLDARIRESSCRDRITRTPYRPDATLAQLYAGADAVLFLSAYEGFGLPVVEAQAHGIPVVCSDIPVLREVGGAGALYVDRANPEAVAEALAAVMRDPARRDKLVRAGRGNASRFSWGETARQTLAVYEEKDEG